jgi:predicted RNA polymerase sigma factor
MAADPVDAADARSGMTEAQLRNLIPGVLAALVHRGADFATAEDAVQEALLKAVETWPNHRPDDPKGLADHHGVAPLH